MKNNLLLGITGSIAASKTEKLYNLLKDQYNIKFVSTSEGLKYLEDNFKKIIILFHHGIMKLAPHT